MLACVLLVAVQQAASTNLSATFTKTYADKTKLRVQLVGEGSGVVRVTSFRPGARLHAQPFPGFSRGYRALRHKGARGQDGCGR